MEISAPSPRKAGRPLSFDRQVALQQAMVTFWQYGYETTSITDLTAAMGVTAPSLYTAFGDKKRLFIEAMHLYAGPSDALQHGLDQAETARDAAREMLLSAAAAFTEPGSPRGCLLASATASGSKDAVEVQKAVADVRRDIIARLQRRIERDITAGLLPETARAGSLATMVVGVIQGLSVLARDGIGRETLATVADCALAGWPVAGVKC